MTDMSAEQNLKSTPDMIIDERIRGAVKHLIVSAEEKVKAGVDNNLVILRRVSPGQYETPDHLTKGGSIELTEADAFRVLEDTNGVREGVILESGTKKTLWDFLDALRKNRDNMLEEFGGTLNGRWLVSNSNNPKEVALEYRGSAEGDVWTVKAYTQDPRRDRINPSLGQRIVQAVSGGRKNG